MTELKHYSQLPKLSLFTKFKWLVKYHIYKFSDFETLNEASFKMMDGWSIIKLNLMNF